MITVIIPLYNKEKSIADTVHSVLNQTYRDFELIIINDGSKDNSLNIVQNIDDSRIVIVDKPNGGVSSARNSGIMSAKNEYLAFLDGDDIWHSEHLNILISSVSRFDNDEIGGAGTTFYKSNSKQFDKSKLQTRFNSSTLLVKKSKVMKTGLFNENLKYGEDVEFWYRLFSNYKLIYCNTITSIYYTAAENRSTHIKMPLENRFHKFNYEGKSASEKKYLDKLVALLIIDYINLNQFHAAFIVCRRYRSRLFGILTYLRQLVSKRLKN